MKNLFGKNNTTDPLKNRAQESLNELTQRINDMEEKIQFLENKKNVEIQKATGKLKAGDKEGAKSCLAKKKKFDEQIKQYDGAIMIMQEQHMMIEGLENLREVFSTVALANQTLKESQKGFTVDDVNDIKDDLEVF